MQFVRYLLSGVAAAISDFGSFMILLHGGMWYGYASLLGISVGFIVSFLLRRYWIFFGKSNVWTHFARYLSLAGINTILSTILLYILVEHFQLAEETSKILSMSVFTTWNFFLYRFAIFT
jgi:putative flippase GtrA